MDLGCGTGLLTAMLSQQVSNSGEVIGVDESDDMLTIARRNATAPNTTFIHSSAESVNEVIGKRVDAVFSNAAFWQFDRLLTVTALSRIMNDGGQLYFNLSAGFLTDNLWEPTRHPYYRQHEVMAKWIELARKRFPNHPFLSSVKQRSPQSMADITKDLASFGFTVQRVEPLSFEIPRTDEFEWLKIPQWTNRTLAPLSRLEREAVLKDVFEDIPKEATFLGRWVMITTRYRR